jgi:hypothetical protein
MDHIVASFKQIKLNIDKEKVKNYKEMIKEVVVEMFRDGFSIQEIKYFLDLRWGISEINKILKLKLG